MKKVNKVFVKCTDCVNARFQAELCYMESGSFGEQGYCKYCPCNDCDNDCAEPNIPKSLDVRKKFKKD